MERHLPEPPRGGALATGTPAVPLLDGLSIPAVGFGTYPLVHDAAAQAVESSISVGYRLIDTAYNYGNEAAVGAGIARSGIDRDELFITTKLPGRHHGYQQTLDSFERSRAALALDVIDLYLIHWPNPGIDQYLQSWAAMIELRARGDVRSIGVSNFTPTQLSRLGDETGVWPVVNQIELHPYFIQTELRTFHATHGIVTESWGPLGQGRGLLAEPVIEGLARRHGVSPAQVVLHWHARLGAIPIPKASSAAHQATNLDLFSFELADSEVEAVSALDRGRLGPDPDDHEEL